MDTPDGNNNGGHWQLFVKGLEGKTTILHGIKPDEEIDEIFRKICHQTGFRTADIRLLYTTKELRYGKGETIADYDMRNNSNLFVVMRLKGGMDTQLLIGTADSLDEIDMTYDPNRPEIGYQAYQPRRLDTLAIKTFTKDMITLDDDRNTKRGKMPCGHAISPESLYIFCKSLLSTGKHEFICPHHNGFSNTFCNARWTLPDIARYAALTEAERQEFEIKITENYAQKALGVRECPLCATFCERINPNRSRVICPVCTAREGKKFEFCWFCLKQWRRPFGTTRCGNEDCSGIDPRLRALSTCSRKEIGGVPNCPSIRACPNCGILIEHVSDCNHMDCTNCGCEFCFICLRRKLLGYWRCDNFQSACRMAAPQTSIPRQ